MFFLFLASLLIGCSTAKPIKLRVIDKAHLPLIEISGLSVKETKNETAQFFAVSDNTSTIATFRLESERFKTDPLTIKINKNLFPTIKNHFQWEALSINDFGTYLLQEPSSSIVRTDQRFANATEIINIPNIKKLGRNYEGLAVVTPNEIILAHKKNPPALVILKTNDLPHIKRKWTPKTIQYFKKNNGKCNFSDLFLHKESLFVLSENCQKIFKYHIADLKNRLETWKFPKKIVSAEGLIVINEEYFIIGVDSKNNEPNIFLLKKGL